MTTLLQKLAQDMGVGQPSDQEAAIRQALMEGIGAGGSVGGQPAPGPQTGMSPPEADPLDALSAELKQKQKALGVEKQKLSVKGSEIDIKKMQAANTAKEQALKQQAEEQAMQNQVQPGAGQYPGAMVAASMPKTASAKTPSAKSVLRGVLMKSAQYQAKPGGWAMSAEGLKAHEANAALPAGDPAKKKSGIGETARFYGQKGLDLAESNPQWAGAGLMGLGGLVGGSMLGKKNRMLKMLLSALAAGTAGYFLGKPAMDFGQGIADKMKPSTPVKPATPAPVPEAPKPDLPPKPETTKPTK